MPDNRKRAYTIILYPDSESYNYKEILDYIELNYAEYAYILHDRDIYPADVKDDSTGQLLHSKGEIKKPHYHVLFKFKDGRSPSAVSKELGLEEHDLEIIKSWKAQVRYLIHLDDEDKVQYSRSDIVSNAALDKYLQTIKEEPDQLYELLHFIDSNVVNNPFTLMYYVCEHPELYPAYRRNAASLQNCINYNARNYEKKKIEADFKSQQTQLAYEKHFQIVEGFQPFTALRPGDPTLYAFDSYEEKVFGQKSGPEGSDKNSKQ